MHIQSILTAYYVSYDSDKAISLILSYFGRYRKRRENKAKTKRTYRCVRWDKGKCRSTAVLLINENLLISVKPHNHSPPFLKSKAR
jgi:hypothetical protein